MVTSDLAKAIQTQYANYLAGTNVPWTRGGIPYIYMFCTDEDVYSATNDDGLTYTQDTGKANRMLEPPQPLFLAPTGPFLHHNPKVDYACMLNWTAQQNHHN